MKKTRIASVKYFKKQKLGQIFSSFNIKQLCIEDVKSNTCNTNNTKNNIEPKTTWFWNKSANKIESDFESRKKSDKKSSLNKALSKIKKVVSMQNIQKKIRWNQKKEDRLRDSYGKRSVSTLKKRKKSAQELEKEASKTYNITALWQHNRNLASISNAGALKKLAHNSDSGIVNTPNQVVPFLQIPSGCSSPKSKQEIQKE